MTKNKQQDQMEQDGVIDAQPEEDYVEGCHKENYMKLHVCPVATGGWCKDYVKCRNLEGTVMYRKEIKIINGIKCSRYNYGFGRYSEWKPCTE